MLFFAKQFLKWPFKPFLKQLMWRHLGSRMQRARRFLSEHKLISGKERMKYVFLTPLCCLGFSMVPWSLLECKKQVIFDFSNVKATHLLSSSHLNFLWIFQINNNWLNNGLFEKFCATKFHSWQCSKLMIPSFRVNLDIGVSLRAERLNFRFFNHESHNLEAPYSAHYSTILWETCQKLI